MKKMTIKMWLFVTIFEIIYQKTSQSYVIIGDINFDCQPCYRRMSTRKRIMEIHIRKVFNCERIEDCYNKCTEERTFICRGFNFRRLVSRHRIVCELTSVPYSRLDIRRDFTENPHYDYYERDLSCIENTKSPDYPAADWTKRFFELPPRRQRPHLLIPGSSEATRSELRPHFPDRRPDNNDRRPIDEHPLSFDHNRQFIDHADRFIDNPRPLNHNRRPVVDYPKLDHDLQSDVYHGKRYQADRTWNEGSYFTDRNPIVPREDQFSPGRPYYSEFHDRRPDIGQPYHDIGKSETGLYSSNRPENWNTDWGIYGSVYGGSYGYDTNYIDKLDLSAHSVYDNSKRHEHPPVYKNDYPNRKFYNYGHPFEDNDDYIPISKDILHHSTDSKKDCSVRTEVGFKLRKELVKKSYVTTNLDQCENLCAAEKDFFCTIFAYRYSLTVTAPTDNCLLSAVPYKDLDFYMDLEPDREYDLHTIDGNSKMYDIKPPQHPPEECFWRISSGFGMSLDMVKKSMFVNNLGKCEIECIDSHNFVCRSFVFRYPAINGAPNCFLSNWHSREMDNLSQPDLDGAELYERADFSRDCSTYPFPRVNSMRKHSTIKTPRHEDEACYSEYHRPCRLTSYSVLLSLSVNSESECRRKCSAMRKKDPIPCMSFSYKISGDKADDNCFLSDIPKRDLRPGLDYIHDDKHVMYAWKEFEPECVVSGYPNDPNFGQLAFTDHDSFNFQSQQSSPEVPQPPHLSQTSNFDLSTDFKPIGDRKYGDLGSGLLHNTDHHTSFGHKENDRLDKNNGGRYDHQNVNELSTFQRFTVNGYPCKSGTRCEKNKVAGFWSCEIEGGELDAWDYCCEPRHFCGFSRNYHYPWCYVGSAKDQWRPCKERYHPYLSSPRPSRILSDRHNSQHNRYGETLEQDLLGRHWPVIYFHGESPPNATDCLDFTS